MAATNSLTPAQQATVKAYILADPVLGPLTSGPGTDYGAISAAMSSDASPAFVVWRTSVSKAEITKSAAYDWTRVDNLSVGKARIWDALFEGGPIDASEGNVRAGIDAAWVGTQADLAVRAAVYVKCKRNGTRIEKVLATGTGSDASPATMGYEGVMSITQVADMFNASFAAIK